MLYFLESAVGVHTPQFTS